MEKRELGHRFKLARTHLDMRQGEIAEKVGISQGDISRLESGNVKNPNAMYIAYLNERGFSVQWLIKGKGSMQVEDAEGGKPEPESSVSRKEQEDWKDKYLRAVEENKELLKEMYFLIKRLGLSKGTELGKPKGVTSPGFVVPHRVTDSVTPSYATA